VEALEERMMFSTVDVFAAGAAGQENFEILVEGVVVKSVQGVQGDASQRDFSQFTWETDETIPADQITVRFANDAFDAATGLDRNLYVDRVVIDGRINESESSATFVSNVVTFFTQMASSSSRLSLVDDLGGGARKRLPLSLSTS